MKLVILAILLAASTARADDPWAEGVPVAQQMQANALFAEANQLFARQAHAPALEKYKAAIALWDHPLIRFNMAVTEIRLDRMLDAADDIDRALRYGVTPFTPELYQEALDYQALIKKQVGTIDAKCTQAGVHVILDGKPWFACPGAKALRVLAGEHVIVGEKKEYLTYSARLVVAGGGSAPVALDLVPIESAVILKYRFARWMPYTVTGSGIAVALGGLAVWLAGRSAMDRFLADFTTNCPTGCKMDFSDHPFLADEQNHARLEGHIGVAMMVTGSAITAAGVVLAVINSKAQRILPSVEVSPSGAMATMRWGF